MIDADFLNHNNCDYVAQYCEENVARLIEREEFRVSGLDVFAVLLSNSAKSVALLEQGSGLAPKGLVFWDYHVVALVLRPDGPPLIFDLDSLLPFPSKAGIWLESSCPTSTPRENEAIFRLVSARTYLECLASDRSHMRRTDGSWLAPPPPWKPYGEGRANNLMAMIDMDSPEPGRVMARSEVRGFLDATTTLGPRPR